MNISTITLQFPRNHRDEVAINGLVWTVCLLGFCKCCIQTTEFSTWSLVRFAEALSQSMTFRNIWFTTTVIVMNSLQQLSM